MSSLFVFVGLFNVDKKEMASTPDASSNFTPVISEQVAIKSVIHVSLSVCVPASITSGQRIIKGTRCPPS